MAAADAGVPKKVVLKYIQDARRKLKVAESDINGVRFVASSRMLVWVLTQFYAPDLLSVARGAMARRSDVEKAKLAALIKKIKATQTH